MLSCSLVRMDIKLGEMHLWVIEVQKRETQIIAKAEAILASIKADHWIWLKELKEQIDVQIGWLWEELGLAWDQNKWLWEELQRVWSQLYAKGSSNQAIEVVQQAERVRDEALAKARFLW